MRSDFCAVADGTRQDRTRPTHILPLTRAKPHIHASQLRKERCERRCCAARRRIFYQTPREHARVHLAVSGRAIFSGIPSVGIDRARTVEREETVVGAPIGSRPLQRFARGEFENEEGSPTETTCGTYMSVRTSSAVNRRLAATLATSTRQPIVNSDLLVSLGTALQTRSKLIHDAFDCFYVFGREPV